MYMGNISECMHFGNCFLKPEGEKHHFLSEHIEENSPKYFVWFMIRQDENMGSERKACNCCDCCTECGNYMHVFLLIHSVLFLLSQPLSWAPNHTFISIYPILWHEGEYLDTGWNHNSLELMSPSASWCTWGKIFRVKWQCNLWQRQIFTVEWIEYKHHW